MKSRPQSIYSSTSPYKVSEDVFFKKDRKKAYSERISPKSKKLQDDFAIFQYLKSDRIRENRSLHMPTQLLKNNHKVKKTFIEMKVERYNKQLQFDLDKRKSITIKKQQIKMKDDLESLSKLTEKVQMEFQSKVSLYSKYYSQELLNPTGYRNEDMNYVEYQYLEQPQNTFRTILRYRAQEIFPKETEVRTFDVKKITDLTNKLKQNKIKITRLTNPIEETFLMAIKKEELDKVHQMLTLKPALISCRNRLLETPMHVAARTNNVNLIELLLRFNPDESLRDMWNRTPRQVALFSKSYNIAKLLSVS